MSEVGTKPGDGAPEGLLLEWHPGDGTYRAWMLVGGLLAVGGSFAYLWIAGHFRMPDSWSVNIILTLILILALGAVHEGVHGLVAVAVGAHPQFGILRQGRMPVGLYTTALGHRFGRMAYLTVALAPLVLIAPLGAVLCWSPLGEVLWLPLACHLGGCIGDLTIVRHVIGAPPNVQCEDLRDGMRLWSAGSGA